MNLKRGLILEGGAMRGMFTCGVLDVFLERGIVFDGAAGISAGAVFGCNFKSGQIGRAIRYNKQYAGDPRYCSLRSLLKTGDLYGADFCYHILPDQLDVFDRKAFQSNPMAFYVGATELTTGITIYHRCHDGGPTDLAWFRASASMPLVSRPVSVGGYVLLDGGMTDPVPYRFMEESGYNRNIIILTQPYGYRKKKSAAVPLMRLFLRQYPKAIQAMSCRHLRYNRQMREICEREASGKALAIRPPDPLNVRRTEKDPRELERVYQIGRKTALSRLDEVLRFLQA